MVPSGDQATHDTGSGWAVKFASISKRSGVLLCRDAGLTVDWTEEEAGLTVDWMDKDVGLTVDWMDKDVGLTAGWTDEEPDSSQYTIPVKKTVMRSRHDNGRRWFLLSFQYIFSVLGVIKRCDMMWEDGAIMNTLSREFSH